MFLKANIFTPKKFIKVVIGIKNEFDIKGLIFIESTKNLRKIKLNTNEKLYTKRYIGKVFITFSEDSKEYNLLKANPKKVPDKNPIPEEMI